MGTELEMVDGQTWRDFVKSDVAVLMLGKSDCEACARWTEELTTWLAGETGVSGVRFGKMLLDQKGLTDFKRENGAWLKDVDVLPFNLIYRAGTLEEELRRQRLERLTNRLKPLVAGPA
ncbi:MAG: hypothetical protein U1F43_22025 [Myxococcota bacterium]